MDKTYRKMTINMPTFKNPQTDEKKHVVLPDDYPVIGGGNYTPFTAPWLKPPVCPFMPTPFNPPPTPGAMPSGWNPPSMPTNDIFSDDFPQPDDDLFDDVSEDDDCKLDVDAGYEVVWEDYDEENYFNINVKNSNFEKNVEQFIRVVTQDA